MRMPEGDLVCDVCRKRLEPGVYFMCDQELDKEWCPDCFEKTDCGQGKHSEDCPTQVLSDGKQ
jgi:hypothetical protein